MGIPLHLLILQLLPILVFLVVDAVVDDPAWAIGSALTFVVFQTAVTWAKKKKLDALILVDAVLIGGLGSVSLISRDELFFKLKPAIIEGIMVPYMLFLSFSADRTLRAYFERYASGIAFQPEAFALMRKLLAWMSLGVLLHAGAVLTAALSWERSTWAWVSGPGFYLLLVPFAGWVVWKRLRLRRLQARSSRGKRIRPTPT